VSNFKFETVVTNYFTSNDLMSEEDRFSPIALLVCCIRDQEILDKINIDLPKVMTLGKQFKITIEELTTEEAPHRPCRFCAGDERATSCDCV